MAKPKKTERQQVIDDIRKKEKGADKRRGFAIVGVSIVLAVSIVGAAAYRPIKDKIDSRAFNDTSLQEIGAAASVCGEVETQDATGNNDHQPTGTQLTYEESPPATGPHWNEFNLAPDPIGRRFYDVADRPELEALMHNSEHGYTILWYDQTVADDADQLNSVKAIASKLDDNDTNFRLKFKAVPWTSDDGDPFPEGQHVAFTHWSIGGVDAAEGAPQQGITQYCAEPSGEALKDFMLDYPYLDSPEPAAG
ncbi:hypothetical protein GCM10027020_03010 [Nocardioides salsibiostraticola]